MAKEFKLPDPGEGIYEAEILEIYVSAGDEVQEGDIILHIETDKAAVEVPSPFTGVIEEIRVKQGDMVQVGEVLMTFSEGTAEAVGPKKAPEEGGELEEAAEVIAGQLAAFDGRAIPAVVYTDPQVAWCGLTEQEANAQKRNISVARFPWNASGRAVSMGVTDGFTKVVMDQESQQVLGVGMVGRHADALIAEGVLAVEMGAVAEDLALTIHPHPTLAETLGEAAEMLLGNATHVFRRREKKEE